MVHGPHILFALLESSARSEREWTGLVSNDAIWLNSLLGNVYDLPPVQEGMTVPCTWIIDAPGNWASCVRLARNQASVSSYLRPIHAMLGLVGVPSPPWADRPKVVEDCDVSDATFKCQDCTSVFNTLQSLQRHRTSAHAISTPGTQWVTSNGICMGCLKLFHTKVRLHRHLQYTHAGLTSCQRSIAATYPPINVAIVTTDYF